MDTIGMIMASLALLVGLFTLFMLVSLKKAALSESRSSQLRSDLEAFKNTLMQQDSTLRMELNQSMSTYNEAIRKTINDMSVLQQNQLSDFAKRIQEISASDEQRMESMRRTLQEHLTKLQEDNAQKLEAMRATVDEKLTNTLQSRLNQSFSLVNERLEQVYKGLGEMQTLANGVGDLKKVLTNVKTRGTWGEISLGNLLEQVLSPMQYAANVKVAPRTRELVEYAICLPGKEDGSETVYLPIDSKFPMEDYLRLVDASEAGDTGLTDSAAKKIEQSIKECARTIRDKYILPPYTTDFAIMYLPTEGLYTEVTKRVGLCELMQRDYRITVMGPTTLGAFLNSLQMGFKTLAIQKRSGEVWKLLGAIKTEFGQFASILEKTQKKIQEASQTIESAANRTRIIEGKLKGIEELPQGTAAAILGDQVFMQTDFTDDKSSESA